MPASRVFTIEEADDLVPQLALVMVRQVKLLGEIETMVRSLSTEPGPLDESRFQPLESDAPEVRERKNTLCRAVRTYRDRWTRVQDAGVVVQDPRLGVVDFRALLEGETVFLCWQHGEDKVSYWHGVDESCAKRRPLYESASAPTLN